jgi:hypothetical protein
VEPCLVVKSGSAAASENVAKRPLKFITLEEKMEVTRGMEGGQSCPTVCKDLNILLQNKCDTNPCTHI